jgi:hypothetical protein
MVSDTVLIYADTNTAYIIILGRPYTHFYDFKFIITARDALRGVKNSLVENSHPLTVFVR